MSLDKSVLELLKKNNVLTKQAQDSGFDVPDPPKPGTTSAAPTPAATSSNPFEGPTPPDAVRPNNFVMRPDQDPVTTAPKPNNRPGIGHAVKSMNQGKAIKEMQLTIQDFINNVVGKPAGVASQKRQPGQSAPVQMTNQPKDRFNEFLVEQYANKAIMKGKEMTSGGKNPSDLTQQNTLLDTMQRIGKSTSERDMEGVWSYRTQNTLENIAAFAEALMKLTADFGVPAKYAGGFTMQDLKTFMARIPKDIAIRDETKFKAGYLEESARIITNLIRKLTVFYDNYRKNITDNPIFLRKIVGDEPLFKVMPGKTDVTVLPPALKDLDKSQLYIKIDVGGKAFRVPVNVLENSKSFYTFLTQTMGFTEQELQRDMPTILKSFKNQVSSRLQELKGSETSAPPKATTQTPQSPKLNLNLNPKAGA